MVLLLLTFCLGERITQSPTADSMTEPLSLEKFLREAKVVAVLKDEMGRSRPWLITLDDGKARRRALFKHFDYRRPQPLPHSYKYELAAYELNRLLGVEIVPPVVERKIEGRTGSLQIFLENCVSEQDRRRKKLQPPDPRAFANALDGIRVFESLVGDECLNYQDLLVPLEDWQCCRVDFSEAFAPSEELRAGCEITVSSRKLYEGLTELADVTVEAAMKAYLSDGEIKALLTRKRLIVEKIKSLIAEKGEAAVLF